MPIEEPPTKQQCFSCDGTGEMCAICGESPNACICSTQEIQEFEKENNREGHWDNCDDCLGTGEGR